MQSAGETSTHCFWRFGTRRHSVILPFRCGYPIVGRAQPDPHHLRDRAGIIAIGLVNLRLQYRSHVSCLNADHRQVQFGQCLEQGSLKNAQAGFYPIIGGQARKR